jgi:O-antigen/teichoic acid export membrane protein
MTTRLRPPTARLRLGALAFLVGSVMVHAGNYGFNLVAVRLLSPAEYADVALTVSLLLFAGFFTVGLQMATARTVAELGTNHTAARRLAGWFARRTFRLGLVVGGLVALATPALTATFQTASPVPILAVALALPWAFEAGVGRGLAQGLEQFGRLAGSFQAEMAVRLGAGVGLMAIGFGSDGGATGVALSVVAAALVVRPPRMATGIGDRPMDTHRLLVSVGPSLALLAGEALVNHVDTIIVKQAFDPSIAGLYAAMALIGRSVFFVTWPISMLVFPIATRRAAVGRPVARMLAAAAGGTAIVGAAATVVAVSAPEWILTTLLGAEHAALAHLLGPYVAATALFAVASTLVSFGLAVGANTAGPIAAGAGLAVFSVLALAHSSLEAVVWAQLIAMVIYVVGAAIWLYSRLRSRRP